MNAEKQKKRSHKAGLPPGSLVYIGKSKQHKVKITVFDYDASHFEERTFYEMKECVPYKDKPTVTWVNIDGIHDERLLGDIAACFGLHPLVAEDIANTQQRPKVEEYDAYAYIVLKMLTYKDRKDGVVTEQVSMILGRNFILSFQEEGKAGDVFDTIREAIRTDKGRIRKEKADYLAYSLIDAIVDRYFAVTEDLGEEIESLEEQLVTSPTQSTLRELQKLKKGMISLRKAVWPLREVTNYLYRTDSDLISSNTKTFLRDVYDHIVQVIDTIETFRDMLSEMLDIYLSSISNRLNEVMKLLTIISTIFIPLTFIVGLYGMNFRYFPELEWKYGYLFVWVIMLSIAGGMLAYFKKKRWF